MPVRLADVMVGRVVDVIYDADFGHALGFDVETRSEQERRHRFLPWVAADVGANHVEIRSVFALLSASELAFYVANGASLVAELWRTGPKDERLADVVVGREGRVVAVLQRERPPTRSLGS
jgi:hypothetical protein